MLHDQPPPERGADVLGADPVEAYRESNAMLHKAFAQPGVLEREFRGPLGVATGEHRLQIRLADLIVHGWDLARATGLQLRIPEELAERSRQLTRASMATQSRAGRFDEPQPVDEDAPALAVFRRAGFHILDYSTMAVSGVTVLGASDPLAADPRVDSDVAALEAASARLAVRWGLESPRPQVVLVHDLRQAAATVDAAREEGAKVVIA